MSKMSAAKFGFILILTLIFMVENISSVRRRAIIPDCVGIPCSGRGDPWCAPRCFCARNEYRRECFAKPLYIGG
ncbi:hypothetical protein MTO96_022473 [Rhipicephalus appendiculatus]